MYLKFSVLLSFLTLSLLDQNAILLFQLSSFALLEKGLRLIPSMQFWPILDLLQPNIKFHKRRYFKDCLTVFSHSMKVSGLQNSFGPH